ncbi:hypothetical protein ACRHK7_01640 [Weissella tructae]|jgi:hypothetical protein|uniref:Uncharacterized protein n=2 Tax=Weissella TaxID=46255 RepID=A0A075TWC9_9LACO|nr:MULTISPECIES: hypothetical protein [Weissella]AIG65874.1 hypothetical protein WS08_0935 [Weissella tructae]AIM63253.1 hypothetical protein WS74_1001 [Weissella ceti]AIM64587.1 hypothetical protein WS105_0997 [Weissella ceti]ELA07245.1 hypothetical protein WCNC_02272 [Weissella ceti NC36]QVV91033.1 hypothetical protein KHQ32_05250 [Weissella tructae]
MERSLLVIGLLILLFVGLAVTSFYLGYTRNHRNRKIGAFVYVIFGCFASLMAIVNVIDLIVQMVK